jgi:hypothetical protein
MKSATTVFWIMTFCEFSMMNPGALPEVMTEFLMELLPDLANSHLIADL